MPKSIDEGLPLRQQLEQARDPRRPDVIGVDDGKYQIVIADGVVRVDRGGQPWKRASEVMQYGYGKLLIAAAYELEELRERVAALESRLESAQPPF